MNGKTLDAGQQIMIDDARFEALKEAVTEIVRAQREMEERLKRLEGGSQNDTETTKISEVIPPIPSTVATSAEKTITKLETSDQAFEEQPTEGQAGPPMETKVGLTVVNRVGVVTLILGVAFFFKWAVDNNWIGPTGRVLLGLLAGLAALAAADFLWRKSQQVFAQGITGAGLAILYLSIYAAFAFYQLIPLFIAFALLVCLTVLAYALALRYSSAALGALGFFGGYLTPFLLNDRADRSWFVFSYVLLLDLAAMRLVKQKRWRALELLALAATTATYLLWSSSGAAHPGSAAATCGALAYYLLFTYAGSDWSAVASQTIAALQILSLWANFSGPFFALELCLTCSGLFQSVRRKATTLLSITFVLFWICVGLYFLGPDHGTTEAKFAGITTAFLLFLLFNVAAERWFSFEITAVPSLSVLAANGFVYFGMAYLLLRLGYRGWLGLLAVCVGASYAGLAFLLRRRNASRDEEHVLPVVLALGMAIVFVTLAIPIQLTGFHITVGWAIQGAALTWIGSRVSSRRAIIGGAIVLGLVALRLVVFDGALYWRADDVPLLLNARFATFLLAALSAFAAARWAKPLFPRQALGEYLSAHTVLLAGLTIEILAWVRRTTPSDSMLSVETLTVSILFALYALALVSLGVASRTAINRISGLALVGFVIVKLYLFDVWQLNRVYRIAAFVALGVLLISTSFLYSRFRPVIESLLKKDETRS